MTQPTQPGFWWVRDINQPGGHMSIVYYLDSGEVAELGNETDPGIEDFEWIELVKRPDSPGLILGESKFHPNAH